MEQKWDKLNDKNQNFNCCNSVYFEARKNVQVCKMVEKLWKEL